MTIHIKKSWMHWFVVVGWTIMALSDIAAELAGLRLGVHILTHVCAVVVILVYASAAAIEERRKEREMEMKGHD